MKHFICFLIIIMLFLSVPVEAQGAGAFLIMDGRCGEILESENADMRLPMASTTKVMTALVALENGSLKEQIKIPESAVGVEGSSLYIKAGESYTLEELLYGLMLRSANDCAVAIAWHIGKEKPDYFVKLMNQKAAELGLEDTCFKNPNGLSAEGHYTTAKDLACLMAYALKNDCFSKIVATKMKEIKGEKIYNHNRLLSSYPYCIGGKTGYTIAAGRCLVSAARRDGGLLICVTLGRRNDWEIHTNAYERWFGTLAAVTLAKKGSVQCAMNIAGGGSVFAVNADDVTARVFKCKKPERHIIADKIVYGNKEAGDVVGSVEFYCCGNKIGESPLVLEEDITAVVKKELFISRIFRLFRRLFLKNI